MLKIDSLDKKFGKLQALKNVNLEFEKGAVYALLGPNGSGKTTLIKSILGLVHPTKGNVQIDGQTVLNHASARSRVGYMPQYAHFPGNVTAISVFEMLQQLRGKSNKLEGLIKHFGIQDQITKKIGTLSGGNMQKISAVCAFMFDADIYILDEPSVGLDPLANFKLKEQIILHKKEEKTILFSSHLMGEVQEIADEIVFLFQGELLFRKAPKQLIEEENAKNLEQAIASIFQRMYV